MEVASLLRTRLLLSVVVWRAVVVVVVAVLGMVLVLVQVRIVLALLPFLAVDVLEMALESFCPFKRNEGGRPLRRRLVKCC